MGDSMTAGTQSYLVILRRYLSPPYRVINAGISGGCALEGALTARGRFAGFSPSVFIYQVYVGNDLFETRHPSNWKAVPPLRNA
jgi:hypothetical protein